MSFGVCLFLQGVIWKYGGKAHTSGLHRDINVPRNFLSSRRLQKPRERMGGRAGPGVGRPRSPLGAHLARETNQVPSRGLCSTNLKDQGEPFNQCRFDPTAQIHLRGLYKQIPWPVEEEIPHYSLAYFLERIQRERFLRVSTS